MVRFELKKMLSRTGGRVALVLLAAVLVISCYLAVSVDYVDEQGISHTGYAYTRKLRAMRKEWAGVLDEELLRKAIAENRRIAAHPDYLSMDIQKSNAVYHTQQGLYNIRLMLAYSYAEGFRSMDYYRPDSLSPDQAPQFYENRTRLLKEWLASEEARDEFSQAEKAYLIEQYEALETPFRVDYTLGWEQLSKYSATLTMLTVTVLGYLLAGLFAGEHQLKADALFFSSYHGRKKAVTAKVKAGFLLVTLVYWVMWLCYSAFVLLWLGADGADTPIQIASGMWKSFYNITQWQKYLLMSFGGYVGCLTIGAMTMCISASTKSAVLAAIVPWLLIFLPSFVQDLHFLDDLLALFPDRLLNVGECLRYFELYSFGNKVVGAVPVQFALYIPQAFLLLPLSYQIYRKAQVT